VSDELDALIHEAADWLRIPSVSAGARNEAALREAAEWALRRVRAAGGSCELVETPGGAPLVVGELRANRDAAPTVMIYGHYDVQDPGDESAWTAPPFEPDIRDGRMYARGACDDKGNFLPLLHVACAMADAGELPVHVRVLIEGAEETGTDDVNQWVLADERGADCVIVFDTGMLDEDTPALTVGTRGNVFATIEIRTGDRPVHSGMYGGAALNAFHALTTVLAAVLPRNGRLAEPLRVGIEPPTPEELATWEDLPDGASVLAQAGAKPSDPAAGAELHTRTGADTSLDVHRIQGGQARTIVPEQASCDLSLRIAPGQDAAEISAVFEGLLREALPEGATLTYSAVLAEPSRFDPASPPLRIGRAALARALGGKEPALLRSGGTLPILAAFSQREIPAIVSGFALPQDNFHAPDESYAIASLDRGRRAARALFEDLAQLR
jgi:acetylornithine deacetylase/succinyl-diaminopimelate desuccinylase-like protein